jgi:hypothetical protein
MPRRVPVIVANVLAKAAQLLVRGAPKEAWAMTSGALGLAPPRAIVARIGDPEARARAFGKQGGKHG